MLTSAAGVGRVLGVDAGFNGWNDLDIRATSATQLYLNTSGNVGIGTTSPANNLQVVGTISAGVSNTSAGSIRIERSSGGIGINIQGSDGSFIGGNGTPVLQPYEYATADNNFNIGHQTVGNFNWYAGSNSTLNLNTHLMRLTRGGNLLLNTTTDAGFRLDVNGTTRLNGNTSIGGGTAGARLDVRAQGALSTDIAFRVRNSADTANLMSVNGNGFIYGDTTTPFLRLSNTFGTLLGYGTNYINIGGANFNFHISEAVAPLRYRASSGMRISDNNQNATDPNSDGFQAVLALTSTTRGFLPPRMTNAQRLAIASPAVGLIVYCTDALEGLYVNKSTGWTFII
jgi:hypothetical protein